MKNFTFPIEFVIVCWIVLRSEWSCTSKNVQVGENIFNLTSLFQVWQSYNGSTIIYNSFCSNYLSLAKNRIEFLWNLHGGLCLISFITLMIYYVQALIVGEISLSAAWMVDISHLLLAVASASNVAIFAAQVILV